MSTYKLIAPAVGADPAAATGFDVEESAFVQDREAASNRPTAQQSSLLLPAGGAATSCAWRRRCFGGAAAGIVALLAAVALAWAMLATKAPGARASVGGSVAETAGLDEIGLDGEPKRKNCSGYPYFRLRQVVRNNLGGQGPDEDQPPGLIYKGHVEGGPQDGRDLDLHINVTNPETFRPQSPKEIGFQGAYGSINLKAGSSATIEMKIIDPETAERVTIEPYYFTFFDLDQGPNGTSSESVTVHHTTDVWTAHNSYVNVTSLPGGGKRFEATTEGSGDDNPKDPHHLNRLQFRKAVVVALQGSGDNGFFITLAVSPGSDPRWFNFRGQPSLLCARKGDGSRYCLREYKRDLPDTACEDEGEPLEPPVVEPPSRPWGRPLVLVALSCTSSAVVLFGLGVLCKRK